MSQIQEPSHIVRKLRQNFGKLGPFFRKPRLHFGETSGDPFSGISGHFGVEIVHSGESYDMP